MSDEKKDKEKEEDKGLEKRLDSLINGMKYFAVDLYLEFIKQDAEKLMKEKYKDELGEMATNCFLEVLEEKK